MRGATKSRATSSKASARGNASRKAVSPSSRLITSSGPGHAVCTLKNFTPSPSLPAGVPSMASTSGASLCTELSLSSSISRVLFSPVPGLKLLVPGRKLVPERFDAVLSRPVEPMFKVKPPVEPMLDNLPLALKFAPVPGREPAAVPRRVEPVVGLVEVVPGRFWTIFAWASACNWATAFSATALAYPPAAARPLMSAAASLRTLPSLCSAALTA
mmetsp:Transcript_29466/g.74025  ORF Transcript_29466/g.74025 Transcript_29466/m.74025 type:complete len:215 (-) Transcript_29466:939-1583(-)